MPRIKFLENFTYKPLPQQTFVYLKDDIALVTQEIADKAFKDGAAELTEIPTPPSGIKETIKKFPAKKSKASTAKKEIIVEVKE